MPAPIEMLDRLRAAGVQLAVLADKDHVSAAPLIEKYFGSERFALVQGRIDAFPPKPEAPVTLHAMEELGADPATTLYVGDSNVDVLTGHNAGLKSAGRHLGLPWPRRVGSHRRRLRGGHTGKARGAGAWRVAGLLLNAAVAILPRGKCIPFQSNIPGRAFRNPPHPETATHYSAKNRVAFSRPLDATPIHQPHPKSVPNCRQKRNVPKCRPNDYHGNAAGRGRTASGHQSEQIGMKRGRHRPSGHAVLFE